MMRLWLIDKSGAQKPLDLGLFKFNDEANCINAAKRKHKFIDKLETNGFEFKGELEPGPLRREKPVVMHGVQLAIEA